MLRGGGVPMRDGTVQVEGEVREVVGYDEGTAFVAGAGASSLFPRPEYQRAAVEAYLDRVGPDLHEGLWRREGRAYPDLAAQSVGFATVYGGELNLLDGTSASTPVMAGGMLYSFSPGWLSPMAC